jgi:DNA-directed RNA polymerase specialized sigma subunit
MTTKEWFSRCRRVDRRLNHLAEQRREEWDRITSITAKPSGDVVDGTKDPHKFDRYAELDSMIGEEIKELLDIKIEVKAVIHQLKDLRHRDILEKRYISMKSWEQIAVEMGYTYRRVTQLHGEALKAAEEYIHDKSV